MKFIEWGTLGSKNWGEIIKLIYYLLLTSIIIYCILLGPILNLKLQKT